MNALNVHLSRSHYNAVACEGLWDESDKVPTRPATRDLISHKLVGIPMPGVFWRDGTQAHSWEVHFTYPHHTRVLRDEPHSRLPVWSVQRRDHND